MGSYPKTASSTEGEVVSYGREAWVLPPSILSERGCSSGIRGVVGLGCGSLLCEHPTRCWMWGNVGCTSAGGSSPPAAVQLRLPDSGLGRSVGGYRLLCASKSVTLPTMFLVGFDVGRNSVFLSGVTVRFFPFYCQSSN